MFTFVYNQFFLYVLPKSYSCKQLPTCGQNAMLELRPPAILYIILVY